MMQRVRSPNRDRARTAATACATGARARCFTQSCMNVTGGPFPGACTCGLEPAPRAQGRCRACQRRSAVVTRCAGAHCNDQGSVRGGARHRASGTCSWERTSIVTGAQRVAPLLPDGIRDGATGVYPSGAERRNTAARWREQHPNCSLPGKPASARTLTRCEAPLVQGEMALATAVLLPAATRPCRASGTER